MLLLTGLPVALAPPDTSVCAKAPPEAAQSADATTEAAQPRCGR
jgi:hypothetical protein